MAICWERAVSLAFHLCCFYFSAFLNVGVLYPFVLRAGYGIRLYLFLIIAFFISFPHPALNIKRGRDTYKLYHEFRIEQRLMEKIRRRARYRHQDVRFVTF